MGSEMIGSNCYKYENKRIDLKTLTKKDGKVSKTLCEGIKKEMERIHPFLASNRHATMFAIMAEQLNRYIYIIDRERPVPREEYYELYRHLIQPIVSIGTQPLPPTLVPTSNEFIERYYSQLEAVYREKAGRPGFQYIEIVRKEAERYVYWVLDQSAFRFKDLEALQPCFPKEHY